MFLYQNLFELYQGGFGWKGNAVTTPFFSNLYLPFKNADRLEVTDLALDNLLIQRDDVSIYTPGGGQYKIYANPANLNHKTDSSRNQYTEYNCNFDQQHAEGGDISFDGESIEAVVVRRSSNRSNFFIWEDVAIIPITTGSLYTLNSIIYDPYIEHGIEYQYAIQPIGRMGRGAQYETLRHKAVYDDIWLIGSDTQQLMMGYNPVVSGYRYIVKDAAIETIGSKYPYVVRNANVGYTQFQFSCTITAHMNIIGNKEVFTPFKDIQISDEYKNIIAGDGSTGSSGPSGGSGLDQWFRPVAPGEENLMTTINIFEYLPSEDGAPIIDFNNKVIFMAQPNQEFLTMETDVVGDYRKIQIPISQLPQEVDISSHIPPGYTWGEGTANPWTDDYLIGFVKEIHCIPLLDNPREEVEEQLPYSVGEIELRARSFNVENNTLEKQVAFNKKLAARLGEESSDTVQTYRGGSLIESGILVDADREYMLEREFRQRVMEFLYDGKPKIFKSPTEGLMLVKLTEISLTPNNQLGRMIYDFSCTMTEIGKIDSSSLAKYGFREALGDIPMVTLPDGTAQMGDEEARELYELFKFK